MEERDLYADLDVPRGASDDEIKKAYRKLARQHHPDVNPGDKKAEERFKELSFAYDVLSDADKRKRYDEFGVAGLAEGFDPEQARAYSSSWSLHPEEALGLAIPEFVGGNGGGDSDWVPLSPMNRTTVSFSNPSSRNASRSTPTCLSMYRIILRRLLVRPRARSSGVSTIGTWGSSMLW